MPLYDYQCSCGEKFTHYLRLSEYQIPQACACGLVATKVISAPAIIADYAPYDCPVTGKRIEGRVAHEENLKRTGCRIYEPGESQTHATNRARQDAALEAEVEATVEQFIEALPVRKKELLTTELQSGADISVDRCSV